MKINTSKAKIVSLSLSFDALTAYNLPSLSSNIDKRLQLHCWLCQTIRSTIPGWPARREKVEWHVGLADTFCATLRSVATIYFLEGGGTCVALILDYVHSYKTYSLKLTRIKGGSSNGNYFPCFDSEVYSEYSHELYFVLWNKASLCILSTFFPFEFRFFSFLL